MKKIYFLLSLISANQVFAHGWQVLPLSRTQYLVASNREREIAYNPQQVASNLQFGWTFNKISANPEAAFSQYHVAQNNNICSNALPYKALLEAVPLNKFVNTSYGADLNFEWILTAKHNPSSYFIFITNYTKNEYNPSPGWKDLKFICEVDGVGINSPDYFKCKMPPAPSNVSDLSEKQVLVTLWQRNDPAGENFISCSDILLSKHHPRIKTHSGAHR
ncbi:MAG: lytic polysaccharide monooxygenase [Burkholderiales bacterium]|nr:lytic polysaccharide monooxygenase [Burkholderiales bacterium]